MKYGTKIKMLRDYDTHRKGSVLVAGDDVAIGVAQALCSGEEPFAAPVVKPKPAPRTTLKAEDTTE